MTAEEFERQWIDGNDFIIAHTSGSTGKPKEIRLKKADMRASACATNAFFGLGDGAVFFCPLDFAYIAAKMMAVRARECGGTLIAVAPCNDFDIQQRVDLLAIVPSQAKCLLKHPEWASRIGHIIIGGAPLAQTTADALMDAGFHCWQTYGMTETCSHVALRPLGSDIYRGLPGIRFSTDTRGCLVIVVERTEPQRFVTNDTVELLTDSTFRWLGRYDNVINSGGIKIFPEELEEEIRRVAAPDFDFYIAADPHPEWGQTVRLVAEAGEEKLDRLRAKLEATLDHKRLPKRYVSVDSLPRTYNNKLIRK